MEREVLVERYSNRSQKGLGVGGKVESVENEGVHPEARASRHPDLNETSATVALSVRENRATAGVPQSPGY